MDNSNANIDLIRSHVDIIILKPLESHDRYGYEILKEIETNSNGLFKLKQPTLYSCLKRLEKQGYINSYLGDESNGAQRRYYSLTQQGRDFLKSMQSQWEFVRTILSGLVSDVDFDKDNDIQPFDPSKYRPLTKRTRSDDEEENIKVVEKVVYVPQEVPKEELTSEELKSKLTEDDIKDIVDEYLKDHDLTTTNQATNEEIDNSYDDNDDFLTSYNTSDAVEEDVALDIDESYQDVVGAESTHTETVSTTMEDLYHHDNNVVNTSNDDLLEELTATQNNNIEEDKDELIEKPVYTRQIITADDLLETKPKFVSYQDSTIEDIKEEPKEEEVHYTTYVDKEPETKVQNNDNTALFDYSNKMEEPKSEEKQEESINIFKALDGIYADNDTDKVDDTYVEPEPYTHDKYQYNTTNSDFNKVETIGELKTKLQGEGFKIKPYTKINSSEFYVNNYYYANRTARDTSLIMYMLFFFESLLAHFVLKPTFDLHFGNLAITWAVAAIVPLFFVIKWAIAPYYKKRTRFSLSMSLLTGLIALLNLALLIFLLGFFVFKDMSLVNLTIVTPLVFLLNIPIYSVIYFVLYKTKKYNLR